MKENVVTNTDTCGDWLMFVLHCLNWSRKDGSFAGSYSAAQPTAWRAFGKGAAERKHCPDNHNLPSTWITVSGTPQTVRSHNRI